MATAETPSTTTATADTKAPVVKDAPKSAKLGNLPDGLYLGNHSVVTLGQQNFIGKPMKPSQVDKAAMKRICSAAMDRDTGAYSVDVFRANLQAHIAFCMRHLAATFSETGIRLRDQQGADGQAAITAAANNMDSIS